MNVTKTGVGVTSGGPFARYSVHSSGRRTVGLGLPGTGTYYQRATGGAKGAQSARMPQQSAGIDPTRAIPKPGLLASGAERAYHQGVLAYLAGDDSTTLTMMEKVLASDPSALSAHLFGAIAANGFDDEPRSIAHLEAVVGSQRGMPDHLQEKYLPASAFVLNLEVRITDAIKATPPFNELAAALALAEAYQSSDRLEEAIGLIQQIYESVPDPLVRLSLCDLLYADGDHEAVLATSAGVANESDIEVETMHLRGAALVATDHASAAVEIFTAALAKTANRDAGLLNAVRYDRALVLEQIGQRKRARADLERVYAADPAFEDVKQRLASMPQN